MASALDFFGDSSILAASEQKPLKKQLELGKRGHEELNSDCDSDENECVESVSEDSEVEGDPGDAEGRREEVPLKLFSSHEPMSEELGKSVKRRKKKKRLKRETRELLRREEVSFVIEIHF